jgi:hypothetical protein
MAWLTPEGDIPNASPARENPPLDITASSTVTPVSSRPSIRVPLVKSSQQWCDEIPFQSNANQ